MADMYKVVGAVVTVKTGGFHGPEMRDFYRHAILPADIAADTIRHLLSVRLIRPVMVAELEPVPGVDAPEPAGETPPGDETLGDNAIGSEETPEDDPERVAARAELSADGSAPAGNAKTAVIIEWLVTKGYDYGSLKVTDRADLVKLLKA